MAEETNRAQPTEDVPLRKLLSREELRELLSPLSENSHSAGEDSEPSVLLLTESAEDVEAIAAYLKAKGVSLLPAANRYAAIDQFRRLGFIRLVSTLEALGGEAPLFFRRIRESSPQAKFAFICGKGGADTEAARLASREGPLVERPLDASALDRLFPDFGATLPTRGGTGAAAGAPAPLPASGFSNAALANTVLSNAISPPAAMSGNDRQTPDPVLGICALLETKIQGGPLREALESWAKKDAAVLGMVRAERGVQPGELTLKSISNSDQEAMRMLADAVALFQIAEARAVHPAGKFLVFPDLRTPDPKIAEAPSSGNLVALCARSTPSLSPWDACRRLEDVIQLLNQLPGHGSAPAHPIGAGTASRTGDASNSQAADAVRTRLLEYLEARMRSCERHNFRLGLLLADVPELTEVPEAFRQLRKALRGCDWLQVEGSTIYVVLDQPERGWQASLARRLKIANDVLRLRIVGAVWNPLGEDAQGLLKRIEKAISLAPRGPFLELLDSNSG